MPIHRDHSDIGWIKRRLAMIERQVQQDRAARRLENATIGKGGLHVRGGDIFLEDEDGNVLWQASKDPTTFASDWAEDNAMSVPTSWTDVYSPKVIAVPRGYWYSLAQINAMVGDSFNPTGNVSCAPLIRWIRADGTSSVEVGPTTNSGNGDVSVANSFYLRTAYFGVSPGASPWTGIQLGVRMVRVGSELSPTSGNWHLSGAVIFKRGAGLS